MTEGMDPKIKLFGKTIQVPETPTVVATAAVVVETAEVGESDPIHPSDVADDDNSIQDRPCSSDSALEDRSLNTEEQESSKDLSGQKQENNDVNEQAQPLMSEELKDSNVSLTNEDPKTPSADNGAATLTTSSTEDNPSETSTSQEKTLKKPDKILPCPRCNSMDTKFCYFNNYNVNQPRHFCKKCQRYWTAGGTMRNVPVGAGRRKNKNAAAHFRHLTASQAIQSARVDLPNGIHHPTLNPNSTVLAFNSDTPLCESMVSVLSIDEKTIQNCSRNGFHEPKEIGISMSRGNTDNSDDHLCGSSFSGGNSKNEVCKNGLPDSLMQNYDNFTPQVPCFSGAPFPYPWNSIQWSTPLSPSAFGSASFPLPFYPTASYWGCAVSGPWNISWVVPPTASHNYTPQGSGPGSPTLGKHSRDENMLKLASGDGQGSQEESNSEKCFWVPKTLRIDDPGEAARSSLWATSGSKKERVGSFGGGGLFKAFQKQSKDDEKPQVLETSTALQANPAALSRSLNFHESS